MIGRLLLGLFGMEPLTERCPTCGHRRIMRAPLALHKDPVARYLDGEIGADEMDRELDRKVYGMADPR